MTGSEHSHAVLAIKMTNEAPQIANMIQVLNVLMISFPSCVKSCL